jgi:DNA repair protein RadC
MDPDNKLHTSIKHWAEDDRPREKMLQHGAATLSKTELVAILINHGTRNKSAIELARDLLETCGGNLHKLARLSLGEIQKIKGLGPAKAVTIKAALELGIRKEADRLSFKKEIIKTSKQAADFLQPILQDAATETFMAIFLNNGSRVLDLSTFSWGGIAGTVVDIRTIARKAIELGATSILAAHNHPSGNTQPSQADKMLTQKLKDGLITLEIKLIDHLIISDEGYFSFADEGMI